MRIYAKIGKSDDDLKFSSKIRTLVNSRNFRPKIIFCAQKS